MLKKKKKELLITLLVSIVMAVIFAIPLKSLCNLCGVPYWFLLVLSGFISYIIAKVIQEVKGLNKDPNLLEFFYIFSLSMSLTFFITIIGYPILGCIISGCIISSSYMLWIVSLSKYLYNLFKDFWQNHLYMTAGGVPSDQIFSRPRKPNLNLDGPLSADNTEAGGSNRSSPNMARSSELTKYNPSKDPLRLWNYQIKLSGLERLRIIMDHEGKTLPKSFPSKSELLQEDGNKLPCNNSVWWFLERNNKNTLSPAQRAYYDSQYSFLKEKLMNMYKVDTKSAEIGAQRLAAHNLKLESDLNSGNTVENSGENNNNSRNN